MNDLLFRVDPGNPTDVFHPSRRRLLERGPAVVGINAILRLSRRRRQIGHAIRKRHLIRLAHPQIDQLRSRIRRQRRPLGPLDLLKFVNGRSLAVANAADALGEEILDVGVHSGAVP